MRFRGREITHPEIGIGILKRLAGRLETVSEIEVMPNIEGNQMTMVLVPARRSDGSLKSEQLQGTDGDPMTTLDPPDTAGNARDSKVDGD